MLRIIPFGGKFIRYRAVSAPPVRSEFPRFFLPEVLVLSSVSVRSVLRISIVVRLESNIYCHCTEYSEYIVTPSKAL